MGVGRLAAVTAAFLAAPAAAQTVPAPPQGGRPAALGRAYTSLAQDAYAPLWNPAGLGVLPSPQAAWLYGAGTTSARGQGAALALPLAATRGLGASLETGPERTAYGLAFGRATGAVSLGASLKHVEDASGAGGAADLGWLYRFDDRLAAGAVAGDLGRPQPQARLASSYAVSGRLAYALEGVFSRGGRSGLRTGLELTALGWLSGRVGVDSTVEDSRLLGLTAGVGVGWHGHGVDLAYVPRGARSLTQLSVVLSFGPKVRAGASTRPSVVESVSGASKPDRVSPSAAKSVSFHLEPSTAPLSGFIAEPPQPDWDKPKTPDIPAKPDVQEPVQPGMIWLP